MGIEAYNPSASLNTTLGSIPVAEGMLRGNVSDSIRQLMADIAGGVRPIITVKKYGAVGDGVADDTAAINAALSDAATAGKNVFIPAGSYKYSGGGVIGNGVTVFGEGANSTTIISTSASPTSGYLFLASGYRAGLRSLRFASAATQTGGSYVWLQGSESFIEDFYMMGDFNGILMSGSVARIRHGRFGDAASGAIRIRAEGGDTSQVIDDVLAGAQTPPNTAAAGIRVRNSSALIISNTSMLQQGTGLLIDPTTSTAGTPTANMANGSVFSLKAVNCLFDNCSRALDIAPTGTGTVNRIRFVSCWFSSATNDGVRISGTTSGVHFANCDGCLNGGSGLTTTGSALSDIQIKGGLWAQNVNALYFNTAFAGLSITGACIGQGGGFSGNSNVGIVIADAAFDSVVVTGNTLRSNSGGAISNASSNINNIIRNNIGANDYEPISTVASAATVALPANGKTVNISGTTGISAITGQWTGREVTLIFTGVLTVTSGTGTANSIRLAGGANFTTAANSSLTLVHNGTQWYEKARAA